jgi:inosine/xanthosine triphosphatase
MSDREVPEPSASPRRIVVGSTNPVKIAAVRAVVARCWPACEVDGMAVESGVPSQPLGDEQTIRGARTRALAVLSVNASVDLAIGLEGGVVLEASGAMRTCAWAVACDRAGHDGVGGSLVMPLPDRVRARVLAGEELGHAMDAVANAVGTKHGRGAVGILTAGLIDRQGAYEPLVTYALARWLAPDYFASGR